MATAKKPKIKGTLAIPYAMDRETGQTVLLRASHVIQQDAVFYDKEKHKAKGCLTCPKCETPDVHAVIPTEVAGSKKTRRDHFAKYPNQSHGEECEWQYLEEEHGPPRQINYNKGGYFYLNTGKLPDRPPYRDLFKKASSRIPKSVQLLPAWISAIDYEENRHGYDTIANDDFKDRPRLRGISKAADYLNLIRSIPSTKLKDTWVINRGVAVRLDKAILRVGTNDFAERTTEDMRAQRKAAGLKSSFLMAANPNYDRFAALLDVERDSIKHPVLLHFKADSKPYKTSQNGETFWRIKLSPFQIENPERRKPQPHQLALPHVNVQPMVNIYDESVLKNLKLGTEFFAIAHPNLSIQGEDTPNKTYYQHFNVLREGDIIQMTQHELADTIKKTAIDRASRAQKAAERRNSQQSIPA